MVTLRDQAGKTYSWYVRVKAKRKYFTLCNRMYSVIHCSIGKQPIARTGYHGNDKKLTLVLTVSQL